MQRSCRRGGSGWPRCPARSLPMSSRRGWNGCACGAAAAWIRHSFHVPSEAVTGESMAELWFVGRDPEGQTYARRQSFALDQFQTGAGGFPLTLGPSSLDVASASGRVDEARWDLRWTPSGEPFGYGGGSRLGRADIMVSQPTLRGS